MSRFKLLTLKVIKQRGERGREGGKREREKRVNDIYSFLDMYSTPSSEEGDGWTVQFHTAGGV